jgi:hypothetical protein
VEERGYSVGVRYDRDRPFAGPRWVTGKMPGSCGRERTDRTGAGEGSTFFGTVD